MVIVVTPSRLDVESIRYKYPVRTLSGFIVADTRKKKTHIISCIAFALSLCLFLAHTLTHIHFPLTQTLCHSSYTRKAMCYFRSFSPSMHAQKHARTKHTTCINHKNPAFHHPPQWYTLIVRFYSLASTLCVFLDSLKTQSTVIHS